MLSRRFTLLNPYVPGEQPKDRPYIKLNANENPYPPAPGVQTVLSNFDVAEFRLYPDPDSTELRVAIAALPDVNVDPAYVFCGNGSDEILSFIFYAFFDSDRPLVFPEHTYSFYPVYAGYYNIPFKKIPLATDFSVNIDALLEPDSCGIICANPNAPTGIYLPVKAIRSLLDRYPRDRVVVIDEAYIDFGGQSVIPLLGEYPNLVVVRTFSKGYCFAGARLGYVVANPELITALRTTKNSFNHFPVDSLTQRIGIAACREWSYYKGIHLRISETRDRFASRLRRAGWQVLPSFANFVFARKKGMEGRAVYEAIKASGILVRFFNHPGITEFVRISIGTPDDMNLLASIMEGDLENKKFEESEGLT